VPVTRVDVLEASAPSLKRKKPIDSRTSSSATAAYASVLAQLPLLGCARSRNVSPRLPEPLRAVGHVVTRPAESLLRVAHRGQAHARLMSDVTVDSVAVTDDVSRRSFPTIGLGELARNPFRRWVRSHAAAMVLASEAWADRHGLRPVARLVAYGIAAVEPGLFGLGPIPAVRQALSRAGWTLGDVERIEINEAFAVLTLAVIQELGLSPDIVNVEGGAIAHGHPIGATGAVLTTRLLHSMRRDGLKRGIVTMCIGGGQGIALAVEVTAP
jgi:Thiolase, C-terminal domain